MNPVDSTVDASILQSTPICEARSASSPALYGLKKSAGRDMMRIIDAASTDMLSFVSIRAWIISFTAVTSSTLTDTHTENTAMATSSRTLPEGSTRAKSSWLIIGESIPSSDSASVARAIIT